MRCVWCNPPCKEAVDLYSKTYKIQGFNVLACADKNLIGKTLKDKKLEVTVSENFYKGEETDEKKLQHLLAAADNINLFGKKCVGIALKKGFIKEQDIIKIAGVLHAQIYKI